MNHLSSVLATMDVHLILKSSPDGIKNKNSFFHLSPDSNKKIVFNKYNTSFDFKSISLPKDNNLFETIAKPLIDDKLLNRKDCLLFTLGPTNSGKSHILFNDQDSLLQKSLKYIFDNLGPISNDFEFVKKAIPTLSNALVSEDAMLIDSNTAVSISMFEIYNDNINDLLSVSNFENQTLAKSKSFLEIITDPVDLKLKPYHLSQHMVNSIDAATELINTGLPSRKTFGTNANKESSRSHCFIFVNIHKVYGKMVETARFTIADLAGLERSKSAQTTGLNLKEAGFTNGSLTQLGRCLELVATKQFNKSLLRTNKLTRLIFNDYVKSHSSISIIVTLDPYGEEGLILQTLRYINPIKYQILQRKSLLIQNSQVSPKKALNAKTQTDLMKEIDRLRNNQAKLCLKISTMENDVIATENKVRQEIYEENEKKLTKLMIDQKKELNKLKEDSMISNDNKLTDLSTSYKSKIENLNKILNSKNLKIESLKESIEIAKSELSLLKIENENLIKKIAELKDNEELKVKELGESLNDAILRSDTLEDHVQSLQLEIGNLRSQHQLEINRLYSEKFNELENLKNEYQPKLETLTKTLELKKQGDIKINELSTSLGNALSVSKQLDDEIEILKTEISELNKQHHLEVFKLREEKSTEFEKMKNDYQAKFNEVSQLKELNDKKVFELSDALNVSNHRAQELDLKIQSLNLQNESLKSKHQLEIAKLGNIKNVENEYQQELRIVEEKLLEKDSAISNYILLQEKLNGEIKDLNQLIESKDLEINESLRKSEQLSCELKSLKFGMNEELKKKTELQTSLKETEEINKILEQAENNLKKELNEKIQEISTLTEEREFLIGNLNSRKDKESELNTELEKLKKNSERNKIELLSELKKMESEAENKEREINKIKESHHELECNLIKERENMTTMYENFNQEIINLKLENNRMMDIKLELEEESSKLRTELESKSNLEIQLDEAQITINKLEERIHELEQRDNNTENNDESPDNPFTTKTNSKNKNEAQTLNIPEIDLFNFSDSPVTEEIGEPDEIKKVLSMVSKEKIARTPRKSLNILDTNPSDDEGLPLIMSSPIRSEPESLKNNFKIFEDNENENHTISMGQASRRLKKNRLSSPSKKLSSKSKKSLKRSKSDNSVNKAENEMRMFKKYGGGNDKDKRKAKPLKYVPLGNAKHSELNRKDVTLSMVDPLVKATKKRNSVSPIRGTKKKLRKSIPDEHDSLELLE